MIDPAALAGAADAEEPERRFTAPSGMDAGKTQIIETAPEPATEIFAVSQPIPTPRRQAPSPHPFPRRDPLRRK